MRLYPNKNNVGRPPERLFNLPFSDTALWGLLLVSLGLFFEALISKNNFLTNWEWLHNLKLISVENSIILFSSILSILAVRSQFILSTEPHFQFKFDSPDIDSLENELDFSSINWNCYLKNSGGGPAKISSIEYYIKFIKEEGQWLNYEGCINLLGKKDLKLKQDYDFPRIMKGSIISKGEEILLLLSNDQFIKNVEILDARIIYYSSTKRKFYKDIPLISRRQDILNKIRKIS